MIHRQPVTATLVVLAVLSYIVWGPATQVSAFQTLAQLMLGVFRHGDLFHLGFNCAVLLYCGLISAQFLRTWHILALSVASALIGVAVELTFQGPGFIGLSGVAYGFLAFALITPGRMQDRWLNAAILVIILIAEFIYLRVNVAVFSHIGGTLVGGGFAMFATFFGTKGAHLKRMERKHLLDAINIIGQTDEDDAHEAETVFLNSGFENMFVLLEKGRVLGVTGYAIDEQVSDIAWLSWTYLDEAYLGRGYGTQMLNDLLGMLASSDVRKIFIETSDYQEDGVQVYAKAHRLYQEFGGSIELTIPDYHAVGEAKLIFGLDNPEAPELGPAPKSDKLGLAILGLSDAPETDDVAGLDWEEIPEGLAGLDFASTNASDKKYRMLVLVIPGDLSAHHDNTLSMNGFSKTGSLLNFYGTDQTQDWWTRKI